MEINNYNDSSVNKIVGMQFAAVDSVGATEAATFWPACFKSLLLLRARDFRGRQAKSSPKINKAMYPAAGTIR